MKGRVQPGALPRVGAPVPASERQRVVIFAGTGRSGSTLVARLLGAVPGFATVGEAAAYLLDERVRGRGIPCSCGASVERCGFWRDRFPEGVDRLAQARSGSIRLRAFTHLILGGEEGRGRGEAGEAAAGLASFYAALRDGWNDAIIVDSSKNPAFVALLSRRPDVEVCAVHLIRDPRGFVHSRRSRKSYLGTLSPVRAVAVWIARNLAAEAATRRADRSIRIRYEELAARPADVLGSLARWASGREPDLSFLKDGEADIGEQHLLAGNPDKMEPGRVRIRAREHGLGRLLSAFVVGLTWPLLLRYGYLAKGRP